MTWNQPLCWICWEWRNPHRSPKRRRSNEAASCCLCSAVTYSGIWVLLDPASVRYPTKEAV